MNLLTYISINPNAHKPPQINTHTPTQINSYTLTYLHTPAQVFDSMGEGGRPIGVVEPNTTVLAEDVLGDFLQVCSVYIVCVCICAFVCTLYVWVWLCGSVSIYHFHI